MLLTEAILKLEMFRRLYDPKAGVELLVIDREGNKIPYVLSMTPQCGTQAMLIIIGDTNDERTNALSEEELPLDSDEG